MTSTQKLLPDQTELDELRHDMKNHTVWYLKHKKLVYDLIEYAEKSRTSSANQQLAEAAEIFLQTWDEEHFSIDEKIIAVEILRKALAAHEKERKG